MKIVAIVFWLMILMFLFSGSSGVSSHDLDIRGLGYENTNWIVETDVNKTSLMGNNGNDESKIPISVEPESLLQVLTRFLWFGMEHIWFGYDHLLFLVSGVLLLMSLRKILGLVSSFTVAHSVTLLLSSFGVVKLPSEIVEPVIALSIVFVVVQNVIVIIKNKAGDVKIKERWWTTFGFGLIHGLGFAGALSEISISEKWFIPSLIVFNVGIELGQLLFLCVLMPILWYVRKTEWSMYVMLLVSVVCGAVAFSWFLERVFV